VNRRYRSAHLAQGIQKSRAARTGVFASAHIAPENEKNRGPREPGFSPRRILPQKTKKIAGRVNRGFRLGASCPGKQKTSRAA